MIGDATLLVLKRLQCRLTCCDPLGATELLRMPESVTGTYNHIRWIMDVIIWEQLEPVPVRTFAIAGRPVTDYAANFRFVKRLDNVRWRGLAWDEAKKLVAHPVLQFIGE